MIAALHSEGVMAAQAAIRDAKQEQFDTGVDAPLRGHDVSGALMRGAA